METHHFFHAKASQRHRMSRISRLKDEGGLWHMDENKIEDVAVSVIRKKKEEEPRIHTVLFHEMVER